MKTNKKHPLAYIRVIDKIYLPEKYDKRKILTADQKQYIRSLYACGEYSYRSLADIFRVSPATIQQTVNDKARTDALAAAQRYRHSTRYEKKPYDAMDLRRRKKYLIQQGIIKLNNN